MNKSQIGGYNGRKTGLDFETNFNDIMKKNNNCGYRKLLNYDGDEIKSLLVSDMINWNNTLLKLEKNEKWLYDFLKNKIPPKDNKRACDIIVFYKIKNKIQHIGIDTKKSKKSTQLMAKSFNEKFFKEYNLSTTDINNFKKYITYEGKKRLFNKNHENFNDIETTIFNIIEKIKINLKTRFDNNNLYYNDIIITIDKYKNGLYKFIYINVDDIIQHIILKSNMQIKKTNFDFQNFISFKPHGSKKKEQHNMQFFINQSIFNKKKSIYCHEIEFGIDDIK